MRKYTAPIMDTVMLETAGDVIMLSFLFEGSGSEWKWERPNSDGELDFKGKSI